MTILGPVTCGGNMGPSLRPWVLVQPWPRCPAPATTVYSVPDTQPRAGLSANNDMENTCKLQIQILFSTYVSIPDGELLNSFANHLRHPESCYRDSD